LDEQANRFLAKNSNVVIVNLGCGLGIRFHGIDTGSVIWAIQLGKKFFNETDRFKFIPKSVTDFYWLDTISKTNPSFYRRGIVDVFHRR
jgi:hypothetical protein